MVVQEEIGLRDQQDKVDPSLLITGYGGYLTS